MTTKDKILLCNAEIRKARILLQETPNAALRDVYLRYIIRYREIRERLLTAILGGLT